MPSALDIISGALRLVADLAAGQLPSTEEQTDGLLALNALVTNLSDRAVLIPTITKDVIATTGTATIAVPGTRPIKIKAASFSVVTTASLPLAIADGAQWAEFMDKANTAVWGKMLYYQDGYPLGRIHIAPRASGSLELMSMKPTVSGLIPVRETFSLTGQESYTIGATGVFVTERPNSIAGAAIAANARINQELEIMTAEKFASIRNQSVTETFPMALYFDGAYPTPNITIAPNVASGGQIDLYSYRALGTFIDLNAQMSAPPPYERLLRFNLAIDLASEYGAQVPDSVAKGAAEALEAVAGLNASIFGPPLPAAGPAAASSPAPVPVPVPAGTRA